MNVNEAPEQLRDAVERMHGGTATLAQSVPVRETFEGKPVWEGVVHVFDLAGHSQGDRRPCQRRRPAPAGLLCTGGSVTFGLAAQPPQHAEPCGEMVDRLLGRPTLTMEQQYEPNSHGYEPGDG